MEVARRHIAGFAVILLAVVSCTCLASAQRQQQESDKSAEQELQTAITLTRQAHFAEAIPHFLAVQGRVRDDYAASFNLALCYVGTGHYKEADKVLNDLRTHGKSTAEVESLLAQALVGMGDQQGALAAAQRMSHLTPKNEKLYLLTADACMESGNFDLGLKIAELGLRQLPDSPRLLFEHGMFLAQLDRVDVAKHDLARVAVLAPGTDIAYIAVAQKSLFEGDVEQALRVAREGVQRGNQHFMLLTLYGETAVRAGITPDRPEFREVLTAVEGAVAQRPNYASAQITLGKLYLMQGRVNDAIGHLEVARQLDSRNPAVFSNLATAYRQRGDEQRAREALDMLATLNREQIGKISTAPGETKRGYAASRASDTPK